MSSVKVIPRKTETREVIVQEASVVIEVDADFAPRLLWMIRRMGGIHAAAHAGKLADQFRMAGICDGGFTPNVKAPRSDEDYLAIYFDN